MSDVFVILATDLFWTVLAISGIYYSYDEVRDASKGVRYFEATGRRLFGRLMRRTARYHIASVALASVLGLLVVGVDLYTWWSGGPLQIDAKRTFYRVILISMLFCLVRAMAAQRRVRRMWKESG